MELHVRISRIIDYMDEESRYLKLQRVFYYSGSKLHKNAWAFKITTLSNSSPFVKSVVPILFCITFRPFLRKTFLSGSSLGADDVFAAIRERLATLNFTSCAGTARISASSAKPPISVPLSLLLHVKYWAFNESIYARISGVKASSSARCFLAFMVLR